MANLEINSENVSQLKLLLDSYHEKQMKSIEHLIFSMKNQIKDEMNQQLDEIRQELQEIRQENLEIMKQGFGKKIKDPTENLEITRKELDQQLLIGWLRDGVGNQDMQRILEKYYGPRKKWGEFNKKIVQWTQKDCILLLKTFDREDYHSKYSKIADLEKLMKREKKSNAIQLSIGLSPANQTTQSSMKEKSDF